MVNILLFFILGLIVGDIITAYWDNEMSYTRRLLKWILDRTK